MNWFSGRLEIILKDGTIINVHDVTFKKACDYLDDYADSVKSSMYYPHPTSLGEVH